MLGWLFLFIWIVITEIVYFGWMRDEIGDFMPEKLASLMFGAMATIVVFGMPWLMSVIKETGSEELVFGNAIFGWWYGIMGGLILFFGINYLISLHLDKKEKAEKKARAKLKRKKKK